MTGERVAVFRPDDDRLERAVSLLESLGAVPIVDPMLDVVPTGDTPRSDADFVVLTSKTGAELLPEGWDPENATLCAIGEPTATALETAGYDVDLVPETYSSKGLLEALGGTVAGAKVEIARSDHGSSVLTEGLDDAGAYHHETVLYRLVRPSGSGNATEIAAEDGLDAALFTSSLTVEHFLEAATDRGVLEAVIDCLDVTVVGAIGEPTRETAREYGIDVDVVPEEATFESLARAVVERLRSS